MKYLAHRGLWHLPEEKNTPAALASALASGHGLETDIRDFGACLVISHDPVPASASPQPLATVLASAASQPLPPPIALNIKADGLAPLLLPLLSAYPALDYFLFDMSVPETLVYRRHGLRYFTRQSEHEPAPVLYEHAAGVWMDMFHSEWISPALIRAHLDAGKQVALVSPELHRREHLPFWALLRDARLHHHPALMLCTDFPTQAREFFHA